MGLFRDFVGTVESELQVGVNGVFIRSASPTVAEILKGDGVTLAPTRIGSPLELDHAVTRDYVKTSIDTLVMFWSVIGNLPSSFNGIDGYRVVPFDCEITKVTMALNQRGKFGNTVVDLNRGMAAVTDPGDIDFDIPLTTLYAASESQPTIPGDNANPTQNAFLLGYLPDFVALNEGDLLSIDIDSRPQQAQDLIFLVYAKKY